MLRESTLAAALVIACSLSGPVHAEPAPVQPPAKQAVYYGDLNLGDSRDAELLRVRLKRAAKSVCFVRVGTYQLKEAMNNYRCVATALRDAEPQVAAAILRAKNRRSFAAGNGVIELAAR